MSRHIEPYEPGELDKKFAELQFRYGGKAQPNNPASRLATEVEELAEKCRESLGLLGEIMATFSIERNRQMLESCEPGKLLLEIADRWITRYDRMMGTFCTGVSANWCPIHGDCTCKDPDDKNDDDCPLHSAESTHAEVSD